MTEATTEDALRVDDVLWDLDPLLENTEPEALIRQALALTEKVSTRRGQIATMGAEALSDLLRDVEQIYDRIGRVGHHARLSYATDTANPDVGRRMIAVEEQTNAISKDLLFVELEWAALDDATADSLVADPALAWCRHHLKARRRYRPYLLSEPEERISSDKELTGSRAWVRLFEERTSAIQVDVGTDEPVSLETAVGDLFSPNRALRDERATQVSDALRADIGLRAFIFNTLLADKHAEDTLRGYPTWVSSRNVANEATDASVQSLVDAVTRRYDICQRWYRLKAQLLGIDDLQDHDRYAPLSEDDTKIDWPTATEIVLDAYASFSGSLADEARRFFDEPWIHAPIRPGKVGGAFCSYTVPGHHPYLLLNWTGRSRDVLTLAHELGHGLHAWLSREQGVFQYHTPLTLAETASVFGETVTFARLMEQVDSDEARLALLAQSIEGNVGTVFRQVAMNRFEDRVHTHRRERGELSVEDFDRHWMETQRAQYGDSVTLNDRYAAWWSYIPHFIAVPGYVYAYAYGQLLALSVYQQYVEQGPEFVPAYLDMLRAGGSRSPAEITAMVDCDLEDPGFWDAGLALIEKQVDDAEALARSIGRIG
jgi:oligoendopeptidase F